MFNNEWSSFLSVFLFVIRSLYLQVPEENGKELNKQPLTCDQLFFSVYLGILASFFPGLNKDKILFTTSFFFFLPNIFLENAWKSCTAFSLLKLDLKSSGFHKILIWIICDLFCFILFVFLFIFLCFFLFIYLYMLFK